MRVNWGGSIVVKSKYNHDTNPNKDIWTDVINPKKVSSIIGNGKALSQIQEWFVKKQCDDTSEVLFVHGPSGVGKSSAVKNIGNESGFKLVHTFADIKRTPSHMESLLNEVSMLEGGVLVLDDFESFLKETSSLKYISKLFRDSHLHKKRILLIVVCNDVDTSFIPLKRISTCVEFDKLTPGNISTVINRLANGTRGSCYIPPMDAFFMASHSAGNATQVINQIQFMYSWTEDPPPVGKRKRIIKNIDKSQKLQKIDSKSKNDSSTRMFFTVYKSSSIDGFLRDDQLLESMDTMNRDFLEMLGSNVHMEYPKYFHNGTIDSLESMSSCMDNISLSDSNRPEVHEDGMYESENAQKWVEDDMNFVVCIHESLSHLKDRSLSSDTKHIVNPYNKKRNTRFRYM